MKSVTSVAICSCRSVGANVGLLSGGTASAAAGTRPPAQAPASTNAVANKPVLILFIIPDPSSIPTQRRHLRPAEARLECPDPPIKGKRHTFATLDKPYAATHHNHRHRPRLGGLHQPRSRRGHADLSHPRGRVSADEKDQHDHGETEADGGRRAEDDAGDYGEWLHRACRALRRCVVCP